MPHTSDVDPEGLLEYSVVYTDRSLNHMSRRFTGVMQDILHTLQKVYGAHASAIIPGSGTFGMEAVVRQFAQGNKTLIVRNGLFSYRWTQILEMAGFSNGSVVRMARQHGTTAVAPWAPCPAAEVAAVIRRERPGVVFAPHVETASGLLLSDDYLRTIGSAARDVGALFVLDCIASGALWVDMRANFVDVLISAPQKGWSSTPGCALVMLGARAHDALENTRSSSFSCDLKKWAQIAEGYERGQHAYHATMPTDALVRLRDAMFETCALGLEKARDLQVQLGGAVRQLLESRGFPSVAADGWKAPGVVVSYTSDADIQNGRRFLDAGLQVAAGVPLQCGEGPQFRTFRIGLFGLDKLRNIERTVERLEIALDRVQATRA